MYNLLAALSEIKKQHRASIPDTRKAGWGTLHTTGCNYNHTKGLSHKQSVLFATGCLRPHWYCKIYAENNLFRWVGCLFFQSVKSYFRNSAVLCRNFGRRDFPFRQYSAGKILETVSSIAEISVQLKITRQLYSGGPYSWK